MITAKIKEQVKSKIPFYKSGTHGFDDAGAAKLRNASSAEGNSLPALLGSTATGLSEDKIEEKRNLSGLNTIQHEKADAWYVQLMHAFFTPFNVVLIVIAAI